MKSPDRPAEKSMSLNDSFINEVKTDSGTSPPASIHRHQFVHGESILEMGKRIVEEEQQGQTRANYGKQLLKSLSQALTEEFGKGFSVGSLYYYRQFYLTFPEIFATPWRILSWSHYKRLMQVPDSKARNWYLKEASEQMWSYRTLDRNIGTQYYHRLLLSQHKDAVENEMKIRTGDYQEDKLEFIKNPTVAEFIGLASNSDFTETDLESAIIGNLQKFLLELGKGFSFVARQKLVRTEKRDYFVDLVFYNYLLKCFVLIDLKTSPITHQDVGQMDMYVRIYDERVRSEGDNPTMASCSALKQTTTLPAIRFCTTMIGCLLPNLCSTCRQNRNCAMKSTAKRSSTNCNTVMARSQAIRNCSIPSLAS